MGDPKSHSAGLAEFQVDRITRLIKIGTALSGEKNHDHLLEMIVSEAKTFTNADGCALYIKDDGQDVLNFMIVQNDSLDIRMGGKGREITWPPVPLKNADGSDNHRNVSAHCAVSGTPINIADVYAADYDFQGTKEFDAKTGYRSRSMLVIPMRDHEDEIIGVIQLLNAQDPASGHVVEFPEHEISLVSSLASQAAIAITNMRLIKGLEDLLQSTVKMIATAIDEKSPYTSGHILRVAEFTERLAQEVNAARSGPFADIRFSQGELEELRLAAWMHDVGKITTPEHVVDKSTKLETIFDRIELVRCRIEILKKDVEICALRRQLLEHGDSSAKAGWESGVEQEVRQEIARLDEVLAFLCSANMGSEFLAEESVCRLQELAGLELELGGQREPLLSEDELANLSVRKGTLNAREREVINSHASLTIKMLESLPFPKKLQDVPLYAGLHHEKLDGSGYPRAIKGDEIPLQARLLAVSDIFEALTAADRPYSQGKLLSEAMKIIGFMVKDNHLDSDICDLMVSSGLVNCYAKQNLSKRQQDCYVWNGVEYRPEQCEDEEER